MNTKTAINVGTIKNQANGLGYNFDAIATPNDNGYTLQIDGVMGIIQIDGVMVINGHTLTVDAATFGQICVACGVVVIPTIAHVVNTYLTMPKIDQLCIFALWLSTRIGRIHRFNLHDDEYIATLNEAIKSNDYFDFMVAYDRSAISWLAKVVK